MFSWNNYLWPLIITNDEKKYVLQVALSQLNGIYYNTNYSMVMAGTMLATLPLIFIFLIFSKQFMSNITAGAIKG
jgi:cellobiose transport system permease protein